MSDIQEEQKRLYKRAKENDYYFKKNNELSSLNTSLRSQRDELQNRINKATNYIHNHQPVFELSSKEQIQEWFEKEYYVELLNILQGSDK